MAQFWKPGYGLSSVSSGLCYSFGLMVWLLWDLANSLEQITRAVGWVLALADPKAEAIAFCVGRCVGVCECLCGSVCWAEHMGGARKASGRAIWQKCECGCILRKERVPPCGMSSLSQHKNASRIPGGDASSGSHPLEVLMGGPFWTGTEMTHDRANTRVYCEPRWLKSAGAQAAVGRPCCAFMCSWTFFKGWLLLFTL